MNMNMHLIQKRKNENRSVRRTRVVCYYNKDVYNKITFGSKITVRHGEDFRDDHNVIDVFADGEFVGHVIHKKNRCDKLANICNNDDVINLIEDDMVVNLVNVIDYQLTIDIPISRRK